MAEQEFSDSFDNPDDSIEDSPKRIRFSLFGWVGDALEGWWRAGVEDRAFVKEMGGTLACPKCGRENSVRTPVCPRCEHRFNEPETGPA